MTWRTALMLIAAAVPLSPAEAQDEERPQPRLGTRLPSNAPKPTVEEAAKAKALAALRGMAACAVRKEPTRSQALMMTEPGSAAETALRKRLDTVLGNCLFKGAGSMGDLYGELRLATPLQVLRGAVAEQLYRLQFGSSVPSKASAAAVPSILPIDRVPSDGLAMAVSYDVGQCVSAREPALVHAMIMAEPGSAEEGAAIRPLKPVVAACLTTGSTFQANREGLRALLAESLYRWSLAQRAAPSAGSSMAR